MSEKSQSNNTLTYTSIEEIEIKVKRQRDFFRNEMSDNIKERSNALKRLLEEIESNEDKIMEAMYLDFQKSNFEAFATEIGLIKSELKLAIKNIKKWSSRSFKGYSILSYPAKLYTEAIPLGNTLIFSPWNYPFLLAISPLIGAISAGNTAIIKPSELTVNTSKLIEAIVKNCFDPGHVDVVQGAKNESEALLEFSFDFIFFTGSTAVGNSVYKKAAEHLCPVLLELGGKSPCIVHQDADIEIAARRIVWGKFLNGGQTCVSPDYLLVHKDIKEALLAKMNDYIVKFYGKDVSESQDYPRIINQKNFDRLTKLMSDAKIISGGKNERDQLYIEPTIIELETAESQLMEEEIFGPLLPILNYESILEINEIIAKNPKPLAIYVFTDNEDFANKLLSENPSGDACINDVVSHFGEKKISVGGIGNSGFGKYRGKKSFEVFSHQRSIFKRRLWPDLPLRYPPYKNKITLLKALLNKL
ncbi:MAG: aldehyde dehydrogenase family protein [Cytophagales bacterium]